ncbi:MAG: DUF349 domain-containing protein [Tannerella sp.]|nr:DUF349 domain-containing protein [Tannerella sp.]
MPLTTASDTVEADATPVEPEHEPECEIALPLTTAPDTVEADATPVEPECAEISSSVDDEEPEEIDAEEEPEEEPEASDMLLKELPTTPDNYCGELQEAIEVGAVGMMDKQNILDELKTVAARAEEFTREQVEKLKQSYYRVIRAETEELRRVFIENGGKDEDFIPPADADAPKLKELLTVYRQKRAVLHEKEEKLKEENYVRKLHLIDRLQALVESQDDFNKRYNEFKEIQQKWKTLDPVPLEQMRELWRNYQLQTERFYDLIKINNQFRDYDFKKNLAQKVSLCETAEKLISEPDVILAYRQMQKLFLQWREIGPVAREFRETLWARFKEASAVINRNHHRYFEQQKANEAKYLQAKTALCEQVENINYNALKTYREWERKTKEVIELQKKWASSGYVAKKHNSRMFERFRTACDHFFDERGRFNKTVKKELEKNLQLRRALLEKVVALRDRQDWKEATKQIFEIQEEWKKIGPVAHKYATSLWKQFGEACDYFFEQKNKLFHSPRKTEESTNLATKRLLVRKIKQLNPELPLEEALVQLKLLIAEWNAAGHVPYKEKDHIYKQFREAVEQQYDRLNVAQSDRKLQQYRMSLSTESGQDKGKLHSERDRLMRQYERMKNELQTYENNVGFFNVSSKGGNNMRKEMELRIGRLKDEMALLVKKIEAIDETLE